MKYVGSKSRHAKAMLEAIKPYLGGRKVWIEPFVGGGNMICEVPSQLKRYGFDSDSNAIGALRLIRDHLDELPRNNEEFTEYDYNRLRTQDHPLKPYVGYVASYGGKWLGGWARGAGRDYVAEGYRNALKQSHKLQGTTLVTCPYQEAPLGIKANETAVYCDPPYNNTQGYGGKFDSPGFWAWAEKIANTGRLMLVSEYECPVPGATCIWEKQVNSTLDKNTGAKKAVERLFLLRCAR